MPSLHYCQRQWDWCPPLIVADMGYLGATAKQQCRERWRVAVLTKLRSDMKLVPPYVTWHQAACAQGEPLTWLGYEPRPGNTGLASAQNRNCAPVVGKRHTARDNLRIGPSSLKRCWANGRRPVGGRNTCCSKCGRGLNRHNPLRRTNWAWATYSSTACGLLGRWRCWRTPPCCCGRACCWNARPRAACWRI